MRFFRRKWSFTGSGTYVQNPLSRYIVIFIFERLVVKTLPFFPASPHHTPPPPTSSNLSGLLFRSERRREKNRNGIVHVRNK